MAFPVTDLMAFLAYAATMSITPGPNNAMLATLGARHGWRGAAPAAAGVLTGTFGLLLFAGTGLGAAFAASPGLKRGLLVASVAYLAYLTVALWHSAPSSSVEEHPGLGYWGAVAFQAVNPKALLMAMTAAAGFLPPAAGALDALLMALLFIVVCGPCLAFWALVGDRLRVWLQTPSQARLFARSMALIVAATAVALVFEG